MANCFNILTPKFTHFMAISSNMASMRSSQKEAMRPRLNVREPYSAMSFTKAAGDLSRPASIRRRSGTLSEKSPQAVNEEGDFSAAANIS